MVGSLSLADGTGPLPLPATHDNILIGWPGGGAGRCRKGRADARAAPTKNRICETKEYDGSHLHRDAAFGNAS
ncbi:hypothetical protein GCM10023219_10280 [Stakelama sediminis]|uniref:Uncharacterized protein n=1 Tax=Stakelama sediminis TaxID=463200 RepID=A0A840YVM3_9SPHN|nr:hypothetical protein [Stakelama sediminis]